jgi:hypothetical protein
VLNCLVMLFEGGELIFFTLECFELEFELSDIQSFVLIEFVDLKCFRDLLLFFQNDLHSFAATTGLFLILSLF